MKGYGKPLPQVTAMHYGFFDGATGGENPGPVGLGFCIYQNEKEIAVGAAPSGFGTNNEAEYQALVWLLETALSMGVAEIAVYGDSQLIINQVNGKWNAGDKFHGFLKSIHEMAKRFSLIEFFWVPRTANIRADALSKRGLSLDSKKVAYKNAGGSANLVVEKESDVNVNAQIEDQSIPGVNGGASEIRIGKKYAVIVESGDRTILVNLSTRRCSCSLGGNCEHLIMVGLESGIELKSA
jgi:ribonuclease HI